MAGADPLGKLLLGQLQLSPAQNHLTGNRLEGIEAGSLSLILGAARTATTAVCDRAVRCIGLTGHGHPPDRPGVYQT